MGDGYNFRQLKAHILSLSKAEMWEVAAKEWVLIGIHEADDQETCPCGHYPIKEICSIKNRVTGQSTEVGNVCVKRFLGLRSDLVFAAIKRIRKNLDKSLNADAVALFHQRGVLNQWEYNFSQSTMGLRRMTAAQLNKRQDINRKVLAAIKKRGFQGPQ